MSENKTKNYLLNLIRYIKNNHQYCQPDGWKDENRLGETLSDRDILDRFVLKHPIEPAITEWSEVKQEYLGHLIDNYDHGYMALFEWLEKHYPNILPPVDDKEVKYQQCPECFNSDKNCQWCAGEGILPIN